MGPAHFGVALAARPLAPKAPVWALLAAGEALDLLFFGFTAAGVERFGAMQFDWSHGVRLLDLGFIPWSHGLFMSLVWSVLAGVLAYLAWRDRRAGLAVGLLVFSHWLLDFIVHPGELPLLFGGSPTVGLGLWASGPGFIFSVILDVGLLVAGLAVYFSWRRQRKTR